MAQAFFASIFLPDDAATTAFGAALSEALEPGDVILLNGAVGAGKSHFSRAIIQARLGEDEEVPSPTYTLVQTYADPLGSEIWHADLYRLGDSSEIAELGLEDAYSNSICLVEWADRLGEEPEDSLEIVITSVGDGREFSLSSRSARWSKVEPAISQAEFLIQAGWHRATSEAVSGDLSSRSYRRLSMDADTAILMNARDDVASTKRFVSVTNWLRAAGYSAPEIKSQNADQGLLLLEDFGNDRLSASAQNLALCVDLMVDIREQPCPALSCPDASELSQMTALASHYPGADTVALSQFRTVLRDHIQNVITNVPSSVSLRDFHADNIMWLPNRDGIRRLGLLDYQDAFLTHPVYDLVSLLTDARRDITSDMRQSMIERYAELTGDELDTLREAFSIFSVQRNLRILGIFCRAATVDGKDHHICNLPRVYGYLEEAATHFGPHGKALMSALPRPDAQFLARIAA